MDYYIGFGLFACALLLVGYGQPVCALFPAAAAVIVLGNHLRKILR